ncbi:WbqC family protein [Embleya sp. MST-111070]|uniref:WbqC family protein n=1 Tax=Embleya sp. MST-111070 TaxID=3398231 RepID=UPI003F73BF0A
MPPRKVCAIHQPNLFPRLSTLAKIHAADRWIVYDDVQHTARDYQHRCLLPDPVDPARRRWLTLPIHRPQGRATLIRELRLVDPPAARKRAEGMLRHHYGRNPYWADVEPAIDEILQLLAQTHHLAEVAEASTRTLLRLLDWQGTALRSSETTARGGRSERLARLTIEAGCDTYLHGIAGGRYMDFTVFETKHVLTRPAKAPPCVGSWRESALSTLTTIGVTETSKRLRAV